jgi:hypothetical protein
MSKMASRLLSQVVPVPVGVARAPSPILSTPQARGAFPASKPETQSQRRMVPRGMIPTNRGLLYVTVQPSASLPPAQFREWYNNEHGPLRLRLPFIKSGFRFRATDAHISSSHGFSSRWPEYLAMYEVSDMSALSKEASLNPGSDSIQSQRERDIKSYLSTSRKIFDFISTHASPNYIDLTSISPSAPSKNVLVAVSCFLFPGQANIDEVNQWYNEEHIEMLSRVPGWLRSTRYVTSSLEVLSRMRKSSFLLFMNMKRRTVSMAQFLRR